MLVIVTGQVTSVVEKSFRGRNGEEVQTFDAILQQGAHGERISGPRSLTPVEGVEVQFKALVRPKVSTAGRAWLSTWVLERVSEPSTSAAPDDPESWSVEKVGSALDLL